MVSISKMKRLIMKISDIWFVKLITNILKMVFTFLSFSFLSTKNIFSPFDLFFSIPASLMKQLNKNKNKDTNIDLGSYMKEKVTAVNQALVKMVPKKSSDHSLQAAQILQEAMHYSLLEGGKRIRPVLCIAACESIGGHQMVAMPAACGVEMIHAMSLIQDDLPCMDNDDFRRGRNSTHNKYNEYFAILASDALISTALLQLGTPVKGVGPDKIVRAMNELAKCVGIDGMAGGQAADLFYQSVESDEQVIIREELVKSIHTRKTGALLQASVVLGAIFGGGSDEQVEKFRQFGDCIGLMFQIVDDILDVESCSEVLGKAAGKDSAAGKLTYPNIIGLEKSKKSVDELRKKAYELLAYFDKKKAAPLIALTDYLATRKN